MNYTTCTCRSIRGKDKSLPRVKQKAENQRTTSKSKKPSVNGDLENNNQNIEVTSDMESVPVNETYLPDKAVTKDMISNGIHAEEQEDEEGRLEMRIAAPWEKTEIGDEHGNNDISDNHNNLDKTEEKRKKKSLKMRTKEKIGNIDINVLQRELSKF